MDEDLGREQLLEELRVARRQIAELEASRDGLRRRLDWVLKRSRPSPEATGDSAEDLVSICASCKSLRDSRGRWVPIEAYLSLFYHAGVTHGICPACTAKVYSEWSHGKAAPAETSTGTEVVDE